MKFVLELWPDVENEDDVQSLLDYAIASIERNPDLQWTILHDDGSIIADEIVRTRNRTANILPVRAGQSVFVVDQNGATFAFASPEAAQEFYVKEAAHGADGLETFLTTAPVDMTWDEVADYACSHGADGIWNPL